MAIVLLAIPSLQDRTLASKLQKAEPPVHGKEFCKRTGVVCPEYRPKSSLRKEQCREAGNGGQDT